MNKKSKLFVNLGLICLTIIIIIDSNTAINAAKNGIELCIQSVIPSLFPMIFLTGLLINSLSFKGLSANTVIFILGAISGYPIGAQLVQEQYASKRLNKDDATRLLSVCNNAGPGFIFGITGILFARKMIPLILWLLQIFTAFAIYLCLHRHKSAKYTAAIHSRINGKEQLRKAITSTAMICGWVILFRILIAIIKTRYTSGIPLGFQTAISGALELTNGCLDLLQIQEESTRFLYCCAFLPFGGLCVMMQTASVISGLPFKVYIIGKVAQTSLCLISGIILRSIIYHTEFSFVPLLILVSILMISLIYLRRKINVAKQDDMLYNG